MTIEYLIDELIKLKQIYGKNIPVKLQFSSYPTSCNCGEYCYCSPKEQTEDINYISKETNYNKKSKKHEIQSIILTM